MDFADEVVITVRSGNGGPGCISFRREKYIPKGGPDGGDGGKGGSIIFHATKKLHSLIDFTSQKYFKAPNGEPGKGNKKSGKNGVDLILNVPVGTVIEDYDNGEILADLNDEKAEIILISGGQGGKGNCHFATSVNRAPRIAQPGLPGRQRRLRLTLKFMADIGIVGFPNAGKSTLLTSLTRAHPKVDSYPFTTLIPHLGVIGLDNGNTVVIADIPGLIEGAAHGRGLGHRFLKHIERTKFILHLLDITYTPSQDILEDFHMVRREMEAYNPILIDKPCIVLINKMDLYNSGHRDITKIQQALSRLGIESLPISAKKDEGLDRLRDIIQEMWTSYQDLRP